MKFHVLIQGGVGDDVWDREVEVDAVDFADALGQANRANEHYRGTVMEISRYPVVAQSTQPTARREGGKIIIELPEDNMVFAVENNPHQPVKVIDREAFLNELVSNLLDWEDGSYDAPKFFKVFEEIAIDMAESGSDCVS